MTEIPDKLFLKIGEVSSIAELEPHVLRYWETEFRTLHPRKNESGQRLYIRRDVETVLKIKNLLYEEGYTISGAKKILAKRGKKTSASKKKEDSAQDPALQACLNFGEGDSRRILKEIREDLKNVLSLLSS